MSHEDAVSQHLMPMRLANSSAGRSAPLRGLQGLLQAPAPRTREELIGFTSMYCIFYEQEILIWCHSRKLHSSRQQSWSPDATSKPRSHSSCSKTTDCGLPRCDPGLNQWVRFQSVSFSASDSSIYAK
jgi:hypothetical protein